MKDVFLPRLVKKVVIPPIKCQGIKSKLVKFIAEGLTWEGKGKWIEPFLGSGVVLFNIQPEKALVSDTNQHIIALYQKIQRNEITPTIVKAFLQKEGEKLQKGGQNYYNEVRTRFNESFESLDFLFLNRSCFNGVIRFNSKGKFNVPFGHKPERFRQHYITKITNQVAKIKAILEGKQWEFRVSDWKETIKEAQKEDFIYLDPPYIGRHADYYNQWTEEEAIALSEKAKKFPCGFALSMWYENKYRKNTHLEECWNSFELITYDHFYHIGSKESLRNAMQEALVAPERFMNKKRKEIDQKPVQLNIKYT